MNRVPRASGLIAVLVLVASLSIHHGRAEMPEIAADMEQIGASGFSCEGKVIGGYYADVDSGCQMFHVCTLGQEGEIRDIKFLCLSGTIFDQETRVCERVDEVDCAQSPQFFDLNLELFGRNGVILATHQGRKMPPGEAGFIAEDGQFQNQETTGSLEEDYEYDDDNFFEIFGQDQPTTTTTTSTTTTARPPPPPSPPPPRPPPPVPVHATPSPPAHHQQSILDQFSSNRPTAPPHVQHHHQPPPHHHQQHHRQQNQGAGFSQQNQPNVPIHHTMHIQTTPPSPVDAVSSWRPFVPQQRPTGRTQEDVDVLKLLDQIEGDVPRIPSTHGAKQQQPARSNNVFIPRFKREASDDSATRRNKTRRTGQRRSNRTRLQPPTTSAPIPSLEEIDEASFSCVGRVQGGFYADLTSGCRRFHICGLGKKNRVVTHSFDCGIGLLFDQASLTCQDAINVDCSLSPTFYHLNDPSLRPDLEVVEGFQSMKEKQIP